VKTKISPAIVGVFVLGGLTLAFAALFAFGGVNFFARPQRFVVYFNESIHGLDLGSPVKLRGVRLGRVVDLNIRYSSSRNESVVAVVCELSRNTLTDDRGAIIDVSDRGELQKLIDRGLRAHLGVLGLATGMLYVELDFADPKAYPAPVTATVEVKHAVVPAMPSAISEFQANLTEILNDMKRIDFAGIGNDLRGLLVDTRKQINGLDLAALNREWTDAGRSIQALASSKEIPRVVENLNAVINDLRGTLGRIDSAVEPTAVELSATLAQAKTTLASFNSAAVSAREFIAAQSGLGEEAARALSQLGEAASAVQRLADYLERNPSSLITGRKSAH